MGLFEIHCHTSESSICGKVDAKDVVKIHKNAGFEGICITDHYNDYHYRDRFDKNPENFLYGYRIAREYGEEIGLKVFLGVEYRFSDTPNDYILLGISEDFIINNPLVHQLSLKNFRLHHMPKNSYLIQAHPMRDGQKLIDYKLLDAMEALNGNGRHNSRNDKVKQYALDKNLAITSGSDFHREEDIGNSPMKFQNEINNSIQLINEIKSGRYELIDNTSEFKGQV